MLETIDNSQLQAPLINTLNEKIVQYNLERSKTDYDLRHCLHLLQEINYLHTYIKNYSMDSPFSQPIPGENHQESLAAIDLFKGIHDELRYFGLKPASGTLIDDQLTEVLIKKNNQKLPRYSSFLNYPGSYLSSLNTKFEQLNKKKQVLGNEASPYQIQEHLKELQSFKQDLLKELTLSSNSEKTNTFIRRLLRQTNTEIISYRKQIPELEQRDERATKVRNAGFYQELSQLPTDMLLQLIIALKKQPNQEQAQQTLQNILPGLKGWQIRNLGGVNNLNWQLIPPGNQNINLVLQLISTPSDNQQLLQNLESSPYQEMHLSKPYFASKNIEYEGQLILTDYCPGGDLKSRREKEPPQEHEEAIKDAVTTLQKLTDLCQNLLKEKVIHPDIKLSNFLLNESGAIIIADKKALRKIDERGNIIFPLDSTPEYAPLEYFIPDNLKTPANAEAYMCYQLGLALYEHLIIPEKLVFKNAQSGKSEISIEYTHEVFKTEAGKKMQELITQMTSPDPAMRPSFNNIQQALNNFFSAPTHELTTQYKYHTDSKEQGRSHAITVSGDSFNVASKYKMLVGDMLKSQILKELKVQIQSTQNPAELKDLKEKIQKSDEFRILNKAQGATTNLLQKIGKNTSSINTLNEMFKEQEDYLQKPASSPSPTSD